MRPTAPKAVASRAGDEGIGDGAAGDVLADLGTELMRSCAAVRTTTLVAEATPVLRSAVRFLVERRLGSTVVEAADLEEFIAAASSARPDIALVDLDLPGLDGGAGISRLIRHVPSTKAIVWGQSPSPVAVYAAVQAGAMIGCLEKDLSIDALSAALVGARADEAPLSARCAALLIAGIHADVRRREFDDRVMRLSRRERDVLESVVLGLRNRAIADRLYVTEPTVKRQVSVILRKLEVRTRREAIELYYASRPSAREMGSRR